MLYSLFFFFFFFVVENGVNNGVAQWRMTTRDVRNSKLNVCCFVLNC